MSRFLSILTVLLLMTSCTADRVQPLTTQNSSITQGNVQISLQVGKTTKADVLENFGSPNITTRDSEGREVWTYQRSAQVSQASGSSGGWTILLAGKSSSTSGFESSTRMITLIIKFDSNDVIFDFNSRISNF